MAPPAASSTASAPATSHGPTLIGTTDARGCALTGAPTRAIAPFEQAVAAFQSWRQGAGEPLARAVHEAPGFVMAHVLQAWPLVCSRDVRRVRRACEPLHVAALSALLDDDCPLAKALLGQLLAEGAARRAGAAGGAFAGLSDRRQGPPARPRRISHSFISRSMRSTWRSRRRLGAEVHRLGGSHAQRDVLHLRLQQAVERMRRPAPRSPTALAAASSRR